MIAQNYNCIFIATSVRWHNRHCRAVPTYHFRDKETGRSGERRGLFVPSGHLGIPAYHFRAGERLIRAPRLEDVVRKDALIDIDKEQWAGQMRGLLIEANSAVRAASAEGAASLPTLVLRTLIKRYNAIVRRGLAFHRNQPPLPRRVGARGRAPRRPGHNLLIRLHKFKRDVLRFLYDFNVPFTNNEVERDLRMMKVKMKIAGGFRTMAGARTFACIRSVISTARKQGRNILQTLTANPATLIHALSG